MLDFERAGEINRFFHLQKHFIALKKFLKTVQSCEAYLLFAAAVTTNVTKTDTL